MPDFPELCDVQNEETERLIEEMRSGVKQPQINTQYNPGEGGPSKNFYDDGKSGILKQLKDKDKDEEGKDKDS